MELSKIFAVDGRKDLAEAISTNYNMAMMPGDKLHNGVIQIDQFSDGEISTNFLETVRGHNVFLLCSTNSSDNIIKLCLAADAAKRAAAKEIIAVMPYYGYARQDRKDGIRGAVGAKVMADMFTACGVTQIISSDLHADQIQGFWNIPVDTVSGHYIFMPYIRKLLNNKTITDLCLVSPDAGGVKRVDNFFKILNKEAEVSFAMISKRRDKPNEVASMDLIGIVKDKDVIIIDDMVDTAGTLCMAADKIKSEGARSVRAICTHGILSGPAESRIDNSVLEELIISDSIQQGKRNSKIKIVSCVDPLVRIIKAINNRVSADNLTKLK
jgi:ribose-phosphate pyrophosphokinase